jgi:hypothetical protein
MNKSIVMAQNIRVRHFVLHEVIRMGKEKKPDRQFKERKNHGENRNGRKAQFKNHSTEFGEFPNEYIDRERLGYNADA